MTLEQRLEKVERENRWMRRIGMVAAAVAAAVFLVGQGKDEVKLRVVKTETLFAKSIHLLDAEGQPRGGWALDSQGDTVLALITGAGSIPLVLRASNNGDGVIEFPIQGTEDRIWAQLGRKAGRGSHLLMNDAEGRARALLEVDLKGNALLTFVDSDKGIRLALGTLGSGAAIVGVRDADQRLRIAAGSMPDGTASISIRDKQGTLVWKVPKD